ncbi:TPA: ROK family transcriptional regulator [Klebsiella aerogenes]|uniref:ROK family transcriptional regulator n=1 Tax=Klebsiella aerogenes TaxID=548 RepID=UPI0007A9B785|nr:ROK family transcriptional regulator [Klebsiella aerogenes]EKU7553755.1 ROK family transcriptional regulator [Klebsiella aerogenes]EKZ9810592.1 ROK family transcriptional regulator [Klebsiella aerogenes]ELA0206297.1 ROK family transcriptional regulator [Klebsiella aerogenes]ELA0227399.1 ROK family transcriptional regulator [Klebsiella aerogenes]MDN3791869.1 ROK family transcriptional regulator [Klebsiella aerogenes]
MLNKLHQQLIHLVCSEEGASRADLARLTGMSKAAIGALVKEMLADGLLQESDMAASGGQGRPSVTLSLAPDAAYAIGISLIDNQLVLVLMNASGEKIAERLLMPRLEIPDVIQQLAGEIRSLLNDTLIERQRLVGIGFALSAFVDAAQAVCVQSALLGWHQVPLAELLSRATGGIPVFIENDTRALANWEKTFGHLRKLESAVVISHGSGIGSATVIYNRIWRGAHGGAGEIAHCTIVPAGTPCRCGKRGCLDTIASLTAIFEQARMAGINTDQLDELEAMARKGHTAAIQILHRAGDALGLAISHQIQTHDPAAIMLAHQPESFNGLLNTVMQQAIETNLLPGMAGKTPLIYRPLAPDSWALAAAGVALTHVLFPG